MKTFGIISEGITDQIVLENILCGYFDNIDLSENIRFVQPFRDNTDKEQVNSFGGWFNVLEYCRSRRFLEAFEQNDYIVIQIDTDRSEDVHYDVKKRNEEGVEYTPDELINKVIDKFKSIFITSFAEQYLLIEQRIIYAICVNEIECWMLPLFYDDKIGASTNSCIFHLNKRIKDRLGFYIDADNKSNAGNNYHKLSKPYLRRRVLLVNYEKNISLKIFIELLNAMNIKL